MKKKGKKIKMIRQSPQFFLFISYTNGMKIYHLCAKQFNLMAVFSIVVFRLV